MSPKGAKLNRVIKIGGACGYWGDSTMATPQLLAEGGLDYIVYDFLAEVTMSIMARAKAKDPDAGYAKDFISYVLKPNISKISKSGTKIIANAGGVNPRKCAEAIRQLVSDSSLDLKIAVVTGDDLLERYDDIAAVSPKEMYNSAPLPDKEKVASINAYLGAFPIAKALSKGADIVITGRCVDSAVTLAPCIHEFGWSEDDYSLLASGSLAGHIIECGAQATGGNFTDWETVNDIANIGYPIAEISYDGSFQITKPEISGGVVSIGTVCEQLLYEIGDPQNYILPDVTCDFSNVVVTKTGSNRVSVSPAIGHPPSAFYKVCATFHDGFKTGTSLTFYGENADQRAVIFAEAAIKRTGKTLQLLNAPSLTDTSIEVIGADSQFGENENRECREVVLKIAAKHETPVEGGVLLKEIVGLGLAAPPGLSGFQGARPKPSPIMRLFSFLIPKTLPEVSIEIDGTSISHEPNRPLLAVAKAEQPRLEPRLPKSIVNRIEVPLVKLAWARSGDKGNLANVGVIARKPEFLPFIWQSLDEEIIAKIFGHFLSENEPVSSVTRFHLPGIHAMNIVLNDVLGGGGVASIRNDAQGKGYAQLLLPHLITIPEELAGSI